MTMMKAMVIHDFGGPDAFVLADVPVPEPQPDEVRIRIACASVNPADWKTRAGLLAHLRRFSFPLIVGFDAAGVIDAVGRDVGGFRIGDRVNTPSDHFTGGQGTYAGFVCVNAVRVQPLPDAMGFPAAATIPIAGTTAWGAVADLGQVRRGDRVFVNGGAGAVGLFAIQIAAQAGATVITTCSPGNDGLVRDYGAERTIDYHAQSIVAELADWAPGGVDLIVDAIGLGSLPADIANSVTPGGRIVSIYTAIKDIDGFDEACAASRDVAIIPNMTAVGRQNQHFVEVMEAVAAGAIRVPPFIELPLAAAAQAHRLSEAGHVRGKIVLTVDDL